MTGDSFYCAAPHRIRTSGQSGERNGRGRSNMAAAKCVTENVLQDKDTRFVNSTYTRKGRTGFNFRSSDLSYDHNMA